MSKVILLYFIAFSRCPPCSRFALSSFRFQVPCPRREQSYPYIHMRASFPLIDEAAFKVNQGKSNLRLHKFHNRSNVPAWVCLCIACFWAIVILINEKTDATVTGTNILDASVTRNTAGCSWKDVRESVCVSAASSIAFSFTLISTLPINYVSLETLRDLWACLRIDYGCARCKEEQVGKYPKQHL